MCQLVFLAPVAFTPVGFLQMGFKSSLPEEVKFKFRLAYLHVLSNADNINNLSMMGSTEPNNQRSFQLQDSGEYPDDVIKI